MDRRVFLRTLGVALLGVACAPPAAAPSPAPAKPTSPPAATPVAPAPTKPAPTGAPPAPAAKATAATKAPTKLSAVVTWKHTVIPQKFDTAFKLMAVEKGFFKEQNLDVQIVPLAYSNVMLSGLIAGEFDSGDFGPSITFPAIEQGGALRIIGGNNPRVPHVLFGKKDINDLKDLYGRTVGVAAMGSFLHALITATMVKEGLDPDKVQFANVGGSPDIFKAVVGGKVDAGVSSIEFEPDIPPGSDVKLVLPFGPRLPDYIKEAVTVGEKTLAQKREAAIAFSVAYTLGHRYAVEHKDETVDLAAKETGGKREVMALAFDRYVGAKLLDLNFYISPSAIQYTQKIGVEQKLQQQVLANERVAVWDIQQAVVKAIGEVKS